MLGLASYESSSEDESTAKDTPVNVKGALAAEQNKQSDSLVDAETPSKEPVEATQSELTGLGAPSTEAVDESTKPIVGPLPPTDYTPQLPEESDQSGKPTSFISISSLRRDMTLPPVPNLDIPPSPPGSPNPEMNKKFEHFLSLKKQGVHFNEKLAFSSSLKNPNLLQSLMKHAGLDERAQYGTSLPAEIWDVTTLPPWAYKDELSKSQQSIRRKLEEKKTDRDAIEFVSSSGNGTPGSGRLKSSAAERVMADLSREPSPLKLDQSKRNDQDKRHRRVDLEYRRHRSRSPGRRKRSRSR
ncbi:hypothetical protein MGYG_09062 [Nannizzia gypsea CBS 118893]|uniref:Uncharacterized protein n=1 Tax=Arthroderma gypseum (strain ATCC MYA-4604 / CBS 118893) TaxID=535722 RepID=E4UWK8_ARTGP|nr:hypothetical protein MGYG_09062 [Nannizzia gypsea CBS 118893]EFR01764.1 hypothetical protein MGYG_09062 [Nannizzia gypsea CBS 118893]